MKKFKVGDKVRSRDFGVGVIEEVKNSEFTYYPLIVKWVEGSHEALLSVLIQGA